MNAKLAKQLRSTAKQAFGTDKVTAEYEDHRPARYQMIQGKFVKIIKGVPNKMSLNCPRKMYKDMKKDVRNS